jgi:hypothetical protein
MTCGLPRKASSSARSGSHDVTTQQCEYAGLPSLAIGHSLLLGRIDTTSERMA